MKEPKRVQVTPSKFDKPGKTKIGGPDKPQRFDNIPAAKPPITPKEAKHGFKRLPSK
jgi:hypothetical protein